MKIESVFDPAFAAYGHVVTGLEDAKAEILPALAATPLPDAGTAYCPQDETLQALPAAVQVSEHLFGGMPCQLGWCNGRNTRLNCLEYHRDSEYNLANEDFILLLARREEIVDGKLDHRPGTGVPRAGRHAGGGVRHHAALRALPGGKRRQFPRAGGVARRHQRPQAGHHARRRRGRVPLGLQQVAAGPPRFGRGCAGRARRADGGEPGYCREPVKMKNPGK